MKAYKKVGALTLTAYNFSSLLSHLCARRTTLVAPLPIATRWQTPYFCVRLTALSPAVLLEALMISPASESERLDDVDRWEDLRLSFGAVPRRSLRLNL